MTVISAYYNEFDPKAAAWLRQLIKNGNITQGEVDERSIEEVDPTDISGFNRVHFFAGIGTWDYCLNQSGWGDRSVWTASLPCQPFSAAGKGFGKEDERHLLPQFLELVAECKPDTILGEQVERAITHGWLDDLQSIMEAEGYAVGHCVLGAHSVGAPHIRQRLYWVADSNNPGLQGRKGAERSNKLIVGQNGMVDWMAYPFGEQREQQSDERSTSVFGAAIQSQECVPGSCDIRAASDIDWIYCRDNKYRPIKPGIQPLVDGAAGKLVRGSDTGEPINANATQEARVMRLKGYGNAIQADTATAFIKAYMSL